MVDSSDLAQVVAEAEDIAQSVGHKLTSAHLLLALFTALDDPTKPRTALAPLMLFGSTAFFFYIPHVQLMAATQALFAFDTHAYGLEKTWLCAAVVLAVLAWPCWRHRKYKAAHPDGWARYI